MRTHRRWTVDDGTARWRKSPGVPGICAVMISSTLGFTLVAQVASSQTLDGSAASVRPNDARAATRHQGRQLATKDVVVDSANALPRHLPTSNSPLPSRRLGVPGVTSALQDMRFAEATVRGGTCKPWGCGENSSVLDTAAVVVPMVRPARRQRTTQVEVKDVRVDNNTGDIRSETPAIEVRKAVNLSARTVLQDARFGQAFGKQLNSPLVDGAAIAVPGQVRAARRHQARQLARKDVVVNRSSALPRQHPTSKCQLPNWSLAASSFTSRLQDVRFGESLGEISTLPSTMAP